jgi:hypothetical protein
MKAFVTDVQVAGFMERRDFGFGWVPIGPGRTAREEDPTAREIMRNTIQANWSGAS